MTRLILTLCLIPAIAHADPRFHEVTPPLQIRAEITTVSSMNMATDGTVTDQGQPVNVQPTITVDEADGPTQGGQMIFIKTVRVDF